LLDKNARSPIHIDATGADIVPALGSFERLAAASPPDQWILLQVQGLAPEGTIAARIWLIKTPGGGAARFDNAYLGKQ